MAKKRTSLHRKYDTGYLLGKLTRDLQEQPHNEPVQIGWSPEEIAAWKRGYTHGIAGLQPNFDAD